MVYDPTEGLINGANLINGLVQHGQATQDYVSGMFDQRAKLDAGQAVVDQAFARLRDPAWTPPLFPATALPPSADPPGALEDPLPEA